MEAGRLGGNPEPAAVSGDIVSPHSTLIRSVCILDIPFHLWGLQILT